MLFNVFYILLVISVLLMLIYFSGYLILLCYSWLKGAPYVSTQKKEIEAILASAHLKAGNLFVELGCGDGRVVRTAVQTYGAKGWGIDINPFLIFLARIRSRGLDVAFDRKNILDVDLSKADYVYIFLFPKLIAKLEKKLTRLKKGTTIISHGFAIPFLEKDLTQKNKGTRFKTYYYKI